MPEIILESVLFIAILALLLKFAKNWIIKAMIEFAAVIFSVAVVFFIGYIYS